MPCACPHLGGYVPATIGARAEECLMLCVGVCLSVSCAHTDPKIGAEPGLRLAGLAKLLSCHGALGSPCPLLDLSISLGTKRQLYEGGHPWKTLHSGLEPHLPLRIPGVGEHLPAEPEVALLERKACGQARGLFLALEQVAFSNGHRGRDQGPGWAPRLWEMGRGDCEPFPPRLNLPRASWRSVILGSPRGRRMEKMTLDSTFSIGKGGVGWQGVGGPKLALAIPFQLEQAASRGSYALWSQSRECPGSSHP